MKTQYTRRELQRALYRWESVKVVALITYGGMLAMFLTTPDIVKWVYSGLAIAALALAVVAAHRKEQWVKRMVAGW